MSQTIVCFTFTNYLDMVNLVNAIVSAYFAQKSIPLCPA